MIDNETDVNNFEEKRSLRLIKDVISIVVILYVILLILLRILSNDLPSGADVLNHLETEFDEEFRLSDNTYKQGGLFIGGPYYTVERVSDDLKFNVFVYPKIKLKPFFPYEGKYRFDNSDYSVKDLQLTESLRISELLKELTKDDLLLENKVTDLFYIPNETLSFSIETLSIDDENSIHNAYLVVNKILTELPKYVDNAGKPVKLDITVKELYEITLTLRVSEGLTYTYFRKEFGRVWRDIYGD